MKNAKYSFIMMVLLSLSSISINTVDSQEKVAQQSHEHRTWQEKRFVASVDADGIQRVEMVGGEYFYNPNYIVVKVNQPVELKVTKTAGYVLHNLIVNAPEAGIDFTINLKSDAHTVSFTPTRTAMYPIYSDQKMFWFKSHRERGMEGLIEVVK
jgi:heme/copper-type cytochrome/quinol oxidase subunit 2